ncbi:enoyl-CoA hydratase/isomerase family protein [Agriterribacter sp.]|uniref:enoyl-CoA hydratase/isomerase family protein n=1 Tax=Agriterribacter sp. TaxID=2821509 RepID=UPI002B7F5EC7|nr:enoyl-CoA hydratase/isomerase family protein [Agriterribacter sp.]HRP54831.1 enoyl-CoA hydratase/isomerase family protein [Agriterribacter sp.]
MIREIQEGYVKVEHQKEITVIEFFHPQSNSLPVAILNDLGQEIHSAGLEKDTKVIVLRSAGARAFCAGASLKELLAIGTAEEGKRFFSGFANVINAMRRCPKLIIARIQGKCVGGGVGLAAAADYAIASEGADVKLSELSIGLGPFVVGPAIERKIGISAFSHLAIDAGMWRPADWARRHGLYAELHPAVEDMDESIQRLANELAHANPEALIELKKILWEGTGDWDTILHQRAAVSGKLATSSFTKTALEKLKKKDQDR